jgi:hypothetical protein
MAAKWATPRIVYRLSIFVQVASFVSQFRRHFALSEISQSGNGLWQIERLWVNRADFLRMEVRNGCAHFFDESTT